MDARTRPLLAPGELITAPRVRELTGITQKELEHLRRAGLIKVSGKNSKHWALYGEDAVSEILDRKRKYSGEAYRPELPVPDPAYTTEQALFVFGLIEQKMSFQKIVLEAQIHPRVFRAILREYELFSKVVFVNSEVLAKMNELPIDGNFPLTTGDMILDVMELASKEGRCITCKRRPKSDRCPGCERARVIRSVSFKTKDSGTKVRRARKTRINSAAISVSTENVQPSEVP